MGAAHSTFSASGADRWMQCPGSIVLSADAPRRTSQYAAEGTAAHQLLTECLVHEFAAAELLGHQYHADGFTFTVDEDMTRHVQVCIDYVRDLAGDDGTLFVDTRVNYSSYLGVPEEQAWGTADVIVCRGDEIIVVDFKYGQGVEVSAGEDDRFEQEICSIPTPFIARKPNRQMALYALGALQAYQGVVEDFKRVRLAISQPRISVKPSEYDLSVEELEAWGRGEARSAACSVRTATADVHRAQSSEWYDTFLSPGEKQCRFCPAKATCPALRAEVAEMVGASTPASPDEFLDDIQPTGTGAYEDARWLAACLSKVDLIEDWCKAVRAEVERRLLAGDTVPGYKLVQGKQGNRAWANPADAENLLKGMRLKVEEMYDLKLISPTTAEKLVKAEVIGPRQWKKVETLITRAAGKPHVAPLTDPRPALDIKSAADDFQTVEPDLA